MGTLGIVMAIMMLVRTILPIGFLSFCKQSKTSEVTDVAIVMPNKYGYAT